MTMQQMPDEAFRAELGEAEQDWHEKQFAGLQASTIEPVWIRVWKAWREAERRGIDHS